MSLPFGDKAEARTSAFSAKRPVEGWAMDVRASFLEPQNGTCDIAVSKALKKKQEMDIQLV